MRGLIILLRPVIGISGSELTKDVGPSFVGYRRSYVNEDYSDSIIQSGGIPFIIPFNEDDKVIEAQLRMVDGLLLSGGHDIDPQLYDEEPMPEIGTVWSARDHFDMKLLEMAEKHGIPVLGICRGAQIINVYHGGSLYQDLKYYPVKTIKHMQVPTPWWQPTHQITLSKGTTLTRIFDEEKHLRVNSFHHQLIKKVGQGLSVSAVAKDGAYEGIENADGSVIGVQWHPEMMHRCYPQMNKLFKYFVERAKRAGE